MIFMLDRRSLPLSALRAFESAGRQLHLGRAGEELGVTHGAVSHQVRALESKLGVKLFTRANNRLRLTSAGEHLLRAVRAGFDRIAEGAQHIDPDSISGELVIGCTQTMGSSWVVNQVMQFQSSYPQMEISIQEIYPEQRNIPPEIDVAICYGKPQVDERRLEALLSPLVFPVCSPGLLFDRPAIESPAELAYLPLLHNNQNSWQRWFDAMGVDFETAGRQTHFFSTALSLTAARNGFGVALCNSLEVQEDLREGQLVRLLDRGIPEAQNYYLLCDKADKQSIRARIFEDWLINVMRNLPDDPVK